MNLINPEVKAAARVALASIVKKTEKLDKSPDVIQNGSLQNVDALVRITGVMKRGDAFDMTPTRSVLSLGVLALALSKLSKKNRVDFIKSMTEAVTEALENGDKVEDILDDENEENADWVESLKNACSSKLPKVTQNGKITFTGDLEVICAGSQTAGAIECLTDADVAA